MADPPTMEVDPNGAAVATLESELQMERAYRVLRTAISNLELQPSEQLSEVMLAQRYGFGRTPVREAVHRLRQDGLVVSIPRRGLFVSSFTVDHIREIYEVLEGLDGIAAYLTTERAEPADLDLLDGLHQQMLQDLDRGDLAGWQKHNFLFHQHLVSMARNQRIIQSFDLLHDQLRRALLLTLPLRRQQRDTMGEHEELLGVMRQGDAERARSIAQRHRRRVRANVLDKLSSIPLPGLRY